MPFLGPRFVAVIPGLFSTDAEESMTSLREFGRILTNEPLTRPRIPTSCWAPPPPRRRASGRDC